MYRGTSMPVVRPERDSNSYVVTKADVDSFSQTPAGLTEGHLTLEVALGLCWLFLACLASAALFRASKSKTNFRDLKVFFPLCNLMPRQNELKPCHAGISGPWLCLEGLHLKKLFGA